MDDAACRPDKDQLAVAIRELDLAKTRVREERIELGLAVRGYSSPGGSKNFDIRSTAMNRATDHYLCAVTAFNAACRKNHPKKLTFSVRFILSSRLPRSGK